MSADDDDINENASSLRSVMHAILDVERIEHDLYRGTNLWRPVLNRGVFGGQVIAQALWSCCRTVDLEKYALNSLHSYFLLAGDASIPILYHVSRVRDGVSYITRTCNAIQNGKAIFSIMVSFHTISEKSQHEHYYEIPDAPNPESVLSEKERMDALLSDERLPESFIPFIRKQMLDMQSTPMELLYCRKSDPLVPQGEYPRQLVWMKARGVISDHPEIGHGFDGATDTVELPSTGNEKNLLSERRLMPYGVCLALHQCVAAYASDFSLLGTAILPYGTPNLDLAMMATIDHSMWFHAPFRADEWLLYDCESPRYVNGRGFALGRIFTADGRLVVSTAQEGVLRFRSDRELKSILTQREEAMRRAGVPGDRIDGGYSDEALLEFSDPILMASDTFSNTGVIRVSPPDDKGITNACIRDPNISISTETVARKRVQLTSQPFFTWGAGEIRTPLTSLAPKL